MDVTLARFAHALRCMDVKVSPAEVLDGYAVLQLVGVKNRQLLKDALSLTFAKTVTEKQAFATTFQRFFERLAVDEAPKQSILGRVSRDALQRDVDALGNHRLSEVVAQVLDDERTSLSLQVDQALGRNDLAAMKTLRDKSHLIRLAVEHLGLERLTEVNHPETASAAAYLRQYLHQQVKDAAEVQYLLRVDGTGQRALLDAALASKLDQLSPAYYDEVDRVVQKLAERIAQRHRTRDQRARRGTMNIRRMIRDGMAYDGALYRMHWRRKKVERATVYVVCDVSNSVSRLARFLLLFLHGLQEVVPDIRSFVFSNELGEVTDLFETHRQARAIEEAMIRWGRGTTDYGRAFLDLRDLISADLTSRSTLVILGDGRNNYFPAHVSALKSLTTRAGRSFWLTPEPREYWREGDCELTRYAAHCTAVRTCARLSDIERFADELMTLIRR